MGRVGSGPNIIHPELIHDQWRGCFNFRANHMGGSIGAIINYIL
jgi:hypothetical protein